MSSSAEKEDVIEEIVQPEIRICGGTGRELPADDEIQDIVYQVHTLNNFCVLN